MYGFVQRAFLEYLAAADLTRRLTDYDLTPEQVLAVYDRRWDDPAWAEVLLLTGKIPDRVATQAITRLLSADPYWRVRDRLPRHLLLALQATTEIRKTGPHAPAIRTAITGHDLDALHHDAANPHWATREAAVRAIAAGWADDPGTLPWLRDRATSDDDYAVRQTAVQAIARLVAG